MRHWWVNQNQTYTHEVGGGYLWSPMVNKNGARNQFYENMKEVSPGDVVFSFCDTLIKAVGIAQGKAKSAGKPTAFGDAGANWGNEGWLVPVKFTELKSPIRPKDHIKLLAPTLPQKYSPIRPTGDGLQSVYLAEVPEPMAAVIRSLLGRQVDEILSRDGTFELDELVDNAAEETIRERTDIPATEKQQLVKARRGQGIYRTNLEKLEKSCRLTGITEMAHLRASHTKPWRDSTDAEKLDGANGLLLSPHIDHLFDRGYISFADNGQILVSPKLSATVAKQWGLQLGGNAGAFTPAQRTYLAYHREHVFQK
jgi:putative restriction endonuclease